MTNFTLMERVEHLEQRDKYLTSELDRLYNIVIKNTVVDVLKTLGTVTHASGQVQNRQV